MTVAEVTEWLGQNEKLVSLVITPVATALLAGVAAWFSARRAVFSARTGRIHQSTIEISGYRQNWIDALRDDLAEFAGITAVSYSATPPPEKVERIAILAMRIRMRMNRSDPDYHRLINSLSSATKRCLLGVGTEDESEPIVLVSQSILKREWERLKSDLRSAEQ